MLTRDLRFEGWTTESWKRFVDLWKPQARPEAEVSRPRGGLVVVHDGARMRKLLHTRHGRIDPGPWPAPLPELLAAHEASWGLSLQVGALEELMERFGARARRSDDLLAQSLSLVTIVRELIGEGRIDFWPRRLRGVPVPSEAVVRRALDSLCPDRHALLLGVFKDGELWTSITLRRSGPGFDVIAGPDELRAAMGVLSSDWRRDHRHLARAVQDRYGELSMGVFAELQHFRDLQVDTRPGAWSRAVALRDIVVSPMPTSVGLAVGVDGARYAATKLAKAAQRVDWLGLAEPLMGAVKERLGSVADDRELAGILGFSPLEVLRALLKR